MVVDVDSSVLVAAGSGAGVVTLVVVEVVSFSLLQPANNANVIKPVAISALFFIMSTYISKKAHTFSRVLFVVCYSISTASRTVSAIQLSEQELCAKAHLDSRQL